MKRDIKRATGGLKINMHYLLQTWVIRTKTKEEYGNKNNEAERDGIWQEKLCDSANWFGNNNSGISVHERRGEYPRRLQP